MLPHPAGCVSNQLSACKFAALVYEEIKEKQLVSAAPKWSEESVCAAGLTASSSGDKSWTESWTVAFGCCSFVPVSSLDWTCFEFFGTDEEWKWATVCRRLFWVCSKEIIRKWNLLKWAAGTHQPTHEKCMCMKHSLPHWALTKRANCGEYNQTFTSNFFTSFFLCSFLLLSISHRWKRIGSMSPWWLTASSCGCS